MSEPEKYSILWDAQRIKELEAEVARLRAIIKDYARGMGDEEIQREAGSAKSVRNDEYCEEPNEIKEG